MRLCDSSMLYISSLRMIRPPTKIPSSCRRAQLIAIMICPYRLFSAVSRIYVDHYRHQRLLEQATHVACRYSHSNIPSMVPTFCFRFSRRADDIASSKLCVSLVLYFSLILVRRRFPEMPWASALRDDDVGPTRWRRGVYFIFLVAIFI